MTQALRPGRAHKAIGVILIVPTFFLELWALNESSTPAKIRVFLALLGVLMACSGAFLIWRGRQYAAKAGSETVFTDQKPDVLYLRSFQSDTSTWWFVFSSSISFWPQITLEEQLRDVLRPIGELVAIGDPRETLPTPGAARIYASEEEWKEVVKGQMQAARLVIIRAGSGEHLLWELKQALDTLNPRKVLIFVAMKQNDYEYFRTEVIQISGLSLPEGVILRNRSGAVAGFIGFATDWKPSVFPFPRLTPSLFFRITLSKLYAAHLKFALRPLFERFGIEWRPPPTQMWTVVAAAGTGTGVLITLLSWIRLHFFP